MDTNEFQKVFWSYYLNLEEKFINTTKYVEVTKDNYFSYSIEYTSLLLNICSEIDVIFKEICNFNQSDHKCINDYFKVVNTKFSNIFKEKVTSSFDSIELTPFCGWTSEDRPVWWENYNNVKHGRLENFNRGNLKNVLNALAGLYILERYLLKNIADNSSNPHELDIPNPPSKIFNLTLLSSNAINLCNALGIVEVD